MSHSIISRLDPGMLFALLTTSVCVSAGVLVVFVKVISGHWARIREQKIAAGVIRELLGRGYDTDQIVRVLEASALAPSPEIAAERPAARQTTPAKPPKATTSY